MQSAMYELWLAVETPWGEIIQRRHGTYQRMGDAQETGDRLLLLYDWIIAYEVQGLPVAPVIEQTQAVSVNANKGNVMLVTFSIPSEFLEELSKDLKDRGAARGVVRCCYTIQRDPHVGFLYRYTLAAGFKNRDGDLVELLAYAGEAADGAKDDLRKIDQFRDKFLAQLKEVAPAVEVRSGRYQLGMRN